MLRIIPLYVGFRDMDLLGVVPPSFDGVNCFGVVAISPWTMKLHVIFVVEKIQMLHLSDFCCNHRRNYRFPYCVSDDWNFHAFVREQLEELLVYESYWNQNCYYDCENYCQIHRIYSHVDSKSRKLLMEPNYYRFQN